VIVVSEYRHAFDWLITQSAFIVLLFAAVIVIFIRAIYIIIITAFINLPAQVREKRKAKARRENHS
jgi:hypothetical protein